MNLFCIIYFDARTRLTLDSNFVIATLTGVAKQADEDKGHSNNIQLFTHRVTSTLTDKHKELKKETK